MNHSTVAMKIPLTCPDISKGFPNCDLKKDNWWPLTGIINICPGSLQQRTPKYEYHCMNHHTTQTNILSYVTDKESIMVNCPNGCGDKRKHLILSAHQCNINLFPGKQKNTYALSVSLHRNAKLISWANLITKIQLAKKLPPVCIPPTSQNNQLTRNTASSPRKRTLNGISGSPENYHITGNKRRRLNFHHLQQPIKKPLPFKDFSPGTKISIPNLFTFIQNHLILFCESHSDYQSSIGMLLFFYTAQRLNLPLPKLIFESTKPKEKSIKLEKDLNSWNKFHKPTGNEYKSLNKDQKIHYNSTGVGLHQQHINTIFTKNTNYEFHWKVLALVSAYINSYGEKLSSFGHDNHSSTYHQLKNLAKCNQTTIVRIGKDHVFSPEDKVLRSNIKTNGNKIGSYDVLHKLKKYNPIACIITTGSSVSNITAYKKNSQGEFTEKYTVMLTKNIGATIIDGNKFQLHFPTLKVSSPIDALLKYSKLFVPSHYQGIKNIFNNTLMINDYLPENNTNKVSKN